MKRREKMDFENIKNSLIENGITGEQLNQILENTGFKIDENCNLLQ